MDEVELRDRLLALEVALATRDESSVGEPLASLIAEDFMEFGASGATWDAVTIRPLLGSERRGEGVELLDFAVDRLADDVALVTYRIGAPQPTNRSSIWVRRGGRWVMRFHQGTTRTD